MSSPAINRPRASWTVTRARQPISIHAPAATARIQSHPRPPDPSIRQEGSALPCSVHVPRISRRWRRPLMNGYRPRDRLTVTIPRNALGAALDRRSPGTPQRLPAHLLSLYLRRPPFHETNPPSTERARLAKGDHCKLLLDQVPPRPNMEVARLTPAVRLFISRRRFLINADDPG